MVHRTGVILLSSTVSKVKSGIVLSIAGSWDCWAYTGKFSIINPMNIKMEILIALNIIELYLRMNKKRPRLSTGNTWDLSWLGIVGKPL